MTVIDLGSGVTLDFVLHFADGTLADSSEGLYPVEARIGDGVLLEAIEQALLGKKPGDRLSVVVPPESGYGLADPSRILILPISELPESARYEGATYTTQDGDGEPLVATVLNVIDNQASVDFNHPYAGCTLHYAITIRDVRAARNKR